MEPRWAAVPNRHDFFTFVVIRSVAAQLYDSARMPAGSNAAITTMPVRRPLDAAEIETEAASPRPHWSRMPGVAPRIPRDPRVRELLAPMDEHTFVTEVLGQRVYHSPCRPSRRAHREILTLDELLDAIAQRRVPTDALRFISGRDDGATDEFTADNFARSSRGRSLLDFHRVRDYLVRGRGSMVAYSLDQWLPSVHRFMSAMGEVTGTRIGANAYYTPAESRVFRPHWDTHDVLVVQLHGTKHWRIYETLLEHPLPGRAYMESTPYEGFADDLPSYDITLAEGDMLYLPCGTPHAAWTEGEDSLHLTGGLMPVRWHDVIRTAVEQALLECEKDLELRQPCAAWFLGVDDPRVRAEHDRVQDRFLEHLRAVGLPDVLASLFADETACPHGLGLSTPPVELDTPLSRVRGVAFVHDCEQGVQLVHLDRRIGFPAAFGPALRWMMDQLTLRPSQLPQLDTAQRLMLARRLVHEGFLSPDSGAEVATPVALYPQLAKRDDDEQQGKEAR